MVETKYIIPGAPFLALLADSHNFPMDAAIASLRAHRPSFIMIAGDFVYGSTPEEGLKMEESGNAMHLLRACAAISPTFLSLGNHEWMLLPADLEMVRSTGVTVLDNEWVEKDGLVIGGLTSARTTACRKRRMSDTEYEKPAVSVHTEPDTGWLSAFCSVPGYHILLSHHPEYFPLLPRSIDLVLGGHCHAGQWRVYNPIRREWQGVFAPGQGIFPRYTKGVYDGRLLVSAGLANTAAPIPRINNPTEIVYISSQA